MNSVSQLEIDIAEYLLSNKLNIKDTLEEALLINVIIPKEFKVFYKEQYEQYVLEFIRMHLSVVFNVHIESLLLIIDRKYIRLLLGDNFLSYGNVQS